MAGRNFFLKGMNPAIFGGKKYLIIQKCNLNMLFCDGNESSMYCTFSKK
jgi:prepilin-type processing-associated H-X9-DG protein